MICQKNKLNNLQSLRCFSFLAIFLYHARTLKNFGDDIPGVYCVSIFFVLSGFVICYSHLSQINSDNFTIKNSFSFATDKIKKIYPLHIIMFIVCSSLVILDCINNGNILKNILSAIANVLLLQAWCPDKTVHFSFNAASWYLSATFFLYLITNAILRCIKKYKSYKYSILTCIIIFFIQLIIAFGASKLSGDWAKWITYVCPLYRAGDYIVGCNIAYIFLKIKDTKLIKETNKSIFTIAEILTLLLGISTIILCCTIITNEAFRYSVLFLPTVSMIILLCALNKGNFYKIFTNKLTIYIGDISSYTYITHLVIIEAINCFLLIVNLTINVYILAAFTLTLTLITCILISSKNSIVLFNYKKIIWSTISTYNHSIQNSNTNYFSVSSSEKIQTKLLVKNKESSYIKSNNNSKHIFLMNRNKRV